MLQHWLLKNALLFLHLAAERGRPHRRFLIAFFVKRRIHWIAAHQQM
ncbi:hypothetical protein BSBH6_00465 [Bacillus subtilis]|nr:hypothetical protein BSBH6_00465 [Bacillus subtilis]RPK26828.1 hypothetical protein BH5_00463 [Bacillus subtilis]